MSGRGVLVGTVVCRAAKGVSRGSKNRLSLAQKDLLWSSERYPQHHTKILVKSERGGAGVWRGSERELRLDRGFVNTTRRYDISTVLVKLLHIRYRGILHLRRIAQRGEDAKGPRKYLSNL